MKYPKATTTCKNSFSFKNKNKIQLKSVMDFVNFRDYQLGELIGTYFRCLAWKYFAFRYWVVLYWWKKTKYFHQPNCSKFNSLNFLLHWKIIFLRLFCCHEKWMKKCEEEKTTTTNGMLSLGWIFLCFSWMISIDSQALWHKNSDRKTIIIP